MGIVEDTDLILLLLHAYGSLSGCGSSQVLGSTRLQKLLFLAVNEMPRDSGVRRLSKSLGFRPYHYGPFSDRVEDSVSLLQRLGLMEVARRGRGSRMERLEQREAAHPFEVEPELESQASYSLTGDGQVVAEKLRTAAGERAWNDLCRLVQRYGGMELGRLILLVYEKYPDMASRSRLRQQP